MPAAEPVWQALSNRRRDIVGVISEDRALRRRRRGDVFATSEEGKRHGLNASSDGTSIRPGAATCFSVDMVQLYYRHVRHVFK